MVNCGLSDDSIELLFENLSQEDSTLKYIDLSQNDLT